MIQTLVPTIHVLVVDDEADVELMFRQKFRKEIKANKVNFHFELSANQTLAYLERPEASAATTLILSDINMPGMNGLEMLRVIKQKYPEILVCMVTAYGDQQSQEVAAQYGADHFINKPVDFEELKRDIYELVKKSSA